MELVWLARKTLEGYFSGEEFIPDEETKKRYGDKRACFVTLSKGGNLRGCVGSLEARQKLWKDVQENVVNAAFNDFRFPFLKEEELDEVKIEVSVLSEAKKLEIGGSELLDAIDRKMGIILRKGDRCATFLPQVWEYMLDKKEFLENLSLKAGLDKDAWKDSDIYFYRVEVNK